MTIRALITRYLSRAGVPTSRAGRLPLLRVEKGFQTVWRGGPGYDEERIRPALALIVCRKPRLFLVRGVWSSGRFCQVYVARGTDFLRRERESDVIYVAERNAPHPEGFPDWSAAVARKPVPPPAEDQPKDVHDFLVEANRAINSAYAAFIGRASNDEVFRADDLELTAAAAAMFAEKPTQYTRSVRDLTAGGEVASQLKRIITRLEYLRDVYSADRETIKAWRSERLEAYDALDGLLARLNHDHEAYQASPEYKRWQAIQDVGALEYPLSPQERTRRDEEREERARLTPLPPRAVPASVRGQQA